MVVQTSFPCNIKCMRPIVLFAAFLTLSSACTACASLPRLPDNPGCRLAAELAPKAHQHPCEFVDALAECGGLPMEERLKIHERCEAEKAKVAAELTGVDTSDVATSATKE